MKGISVYKGIAMGKPYIFNKQKIEISYETIPKESRDEQTKKLQSVLEHTEKQLETIKEKTKENIGESEAEIFDAHIVMLQDPMFLDGITKYINNGYLAEASVEKTRKELEEMFLNIPDPYIQGRVADLNDISNRLIKNLKGIKSETLSDIHEDVIVFGEDLTPSDTALLSKNVKGIVTEVGTQTSHAAIMAKSMGLPAVVGATKIIEEVKNVHFLVLDTIENKMILDPSEEIICEYKNKLNEINKKKEKLKTLKDKKAVTLDGYIIQLLANIGSEVELPYIHENGGEGIGLLRTEFVYMQSDHFPTEEEQFSIYKKIAENGGEEIIIRTLDIGGDKQLPYYQFNKEMNPFLGFRAIRFCLDQKELFKTQLRAILRASTFGSIKIMYPMISSLEQVHEANQVLEECKKELSKEGIEYDKDIPVGIMIEIPGVALISDVLIEEVDFFSIGTNDLCQYTLAVDRMNEKVAHLYEPLHPGIIRLIDIVITNAHKVNKKVGVCGEMAGDPMNALILVGLGVDELSMSPSSLPTIKEMIRKMKYEDARKIAEKALQCKTTEDIKKKIQKHNIY